MQLDFLPRDARCALIFLGLSWAFAAPVMGASSADIGGTIAVLDFELQDDLKYGGHAPGHDEAQRRTRELAAGVRKAVAAGLRYKLVDLEPYQDRYDKIRSSQAHIHKCESCFLDYAREVGSDYVLIGWVQRVSNLIINFNVKIYDVASGALVDGGSIDIRGNTDKTWQDGLGYLVRHLPVGF